MREWQRYTVAAVAIILIVGRMFFPKLVFDSTSLALFGIAVVAFFLPYITKMEVAGFKVELDHQIEILKDKVILSEQEPRPKAAKAVQETSLWREYFKRYNEITTSRLSNVEKVLAATNLVTEMLWDVVRTFEIEGANLGRDPRAIVRTMVEQGFLTNVEGEAFDELWSIRNEIIHGKHGQLTDEQTVRLLDLTWRLVQTLS
jgi:hypothetical protein